MRVEDFKVEGREIRVQSSGLGLRVQGLGYGVEGPGLRAWGLEFGV